MQRKRGELVPIGEVVSGLDDVPAVSAGGPPAALSAPNLEWVGNRGGRASASQQTFRRQGSGCRVGRTTGRRPLPVFDSNHVPHLEGT